MKYVYILKPNKGKSPDDNIVITASTMSEVSALLYTEHASIDDYTTVGIYKIQNKSITSTKLRAGRIYGK